MLKKSLAILVTVVILLAIIGLLLPRITSGVPGGQSLALALR
jgi:hypothetical protein